MLINELRLGNWFRWSDYASMGQGYDRIKKGSDIDSYIHLKEPIPLTEEILLKCGFETEDDQFTGIELPYYSLPGTPYFFHKGDLNELLHDEFGRFSIKVQNLHSLQNVIFSLTGKELTIDL